MTPSSRSPLRIRLAPRVWPDSRPTATGLRSRRGAQGARRFGSLDGVPSWSGDGRWIYFSSTRAGVVPDVWRVSPDGGGAIRMTRTGGFEPRESPDERYLFYLDRHPGGLPIGGTARLM